MKKYRYTALLTFIISLMMVVSVVFPTVASAEDSMTSSATQETTHQDTAEQLTAQDTADELTKKDTADQLITSSPAFDAEKIIDGVKVKVSADANVFPEGTTMEVKKVTLTSQEKKLISEKQDDNKSTIKQYSFDITMKNKDGEEIEPDTSKGKVKVTFTNDYVKMLSTDVYHIVDDKKAETLKLDQVKDTITGETKSFSTYVIDFNYDNSKIYYLYGDSSVLASKLLAQLLTDGTTIDESKITNVTSTKSYITASKADNKWTISADPNTKSDVSAGADVTITYDGNDYTINVKYTKTKDTTGKTDSWINNFNYTPSGQTVTLTKFIGTVKSISIYPTVTIKGTEYNNVKVKSSLFAVSNSPNAKNLEEINFIGSSSKSIATADTSLMSFFYGCTSLNKVDLSGLNTSNVTNMVSFFSGCTSLTNDGKTSYIKFNNGDKSYFTTSKVTNMSYMFYGSGITKLDLSGFDVSSLTDMYSMFANCSGLKEINLSSFNGAVSTEYASTPGLPSSFYPFTGCNNLEEITFGSNWHHADSKTYLKLGVSGYWKYTSTSNIYTSDELDSSFDGSTMAGTYKRVNVAGSDPQYEANGSLYGNNIWEIHDPAHAFHGYCLNIKKHYPDGYYDKVKLDDNINKKTNSDENGHSNYIGDYISSNSGCETIGGASPTMNRALIALIYWSDDFISKGQLNQTEAQDLIWLYTDQYDLIANKDYTNETQTIEFDHTNKIFKFYSIDSGGNRTKLKYTWDLKTYNYDNIPDHDKVKLYIYSPSSSNTENVQNLLSIEGIHPDVRAGVRVKKEDQFGNPVIGAKFGLYEDKNNDGNFSEDEQKTTFTTSELGYGGIFSMDKTTGLTEGSYAVKEISAPNGYSIETENIDKFYKFEVGPNDDQKIIDVGDKVTSSDGTSKVVIRNTKIRDKGAGLEIVKKDSNNHLLQGAEFTITDVTEGVDDSLKDKTITIVTGQDGIARTGKLSLQIGHKYHIVETKAPDGYEVNPNIEDVTVKDDDNLKYIQRTVIDNSDIPHDGKLIIRKIVTGLPLSDDTFKFKLSLLLPMTNFNESLAKYPITMKIVSEDGSEDYSGRFIPTGTSDGITTYLMNFSLKNGQYLYISGLPSKEDGKYTYQVSESSYDGYTTYVKNGDGSYTQTNSTGGNITSTSTVVFKNEIQNVVPTSADTFTRSPFWITIALGALVVIYIKKRKKKLMTNRM